MKRPPRTEFDQETHSSMRKIDNHDQTTKEIMNSVFGIFILILFMQSLSIMLHCILIEEYNCKTNQDKIMTEARLFLVPKHNSLEALIPNADCECMLILS